MIAHRPVITWRYEHGADPLSTLVDVARALGYRRASEAAMVLKRHRARFAQDEARKIEFTASDGWPRTGWALSPMGVIRLCLWSRMPKASALLYVVAAQFHLEEAARAMAEEVLADSTARRRVTRLVDPRVEGRTPSGLRWVLVERPCLDCGKTIRRRMYRRKGYSCAITRCARCMHRKYHGLKGGRCPGCGRDQTGEDNAYPRRYCAACISAWNCSKCGRRSGRSKDWRFCHACDREKYRRRKGMRPVSAKAMATLLRDQIALLVDPPRRTGHSPLRMGLALGLIAVGRRLDEAAAIAHVDTRRVDRLVRRIRWAPWRSM